MIVCTQCSGKKIVNAQEAIVDPSGNTENFTMSAPAQATSTCQQCGGNGYY